VSFAGGAFISSFLGGSWINMPTTGASGLGSGGAGTDAWIAYSASAGQYFTNAVVGDICYRNTTSRLLFGNTSGNATMVISTNNITTSIPFINTNTVESSSTISGSVILSGGMGISKKLFVGGNIRAPAIELLGSVSGNIVTISADSSTSVSNYTLPVSQPPRNNFILSSSTGGVTAWSPPYGYDLQYQQNLTNSTTTSNSFQNRLTLGSSPLYGGTYKIKCQGIVYPATTGRDAQMRLTIDGATIQTLQTSADRTGGQLFLSIEYNTTFASNDTPVFTLDYRSVSNGQTTNIQFALLEIFRISN
jgi:hypothetical protein